MVEFLQGAVGEVSEEFSCVHVLSVPFAPRARLALWVQGSEVDPPGLRPDTSRMISRCRPTSTGGEAGLNDPHLRRRVQEQIDRANETLARVEQIKKFTLLPLAWRSGQELTPTMKLRRRVIDELYAVESEELYA